MEELVLKAKSREIVGKQVKALRREGRLPCVIYGRGFKPVLITLDMREATRILPTITSSHLVVVDVDGKHHTTLVREKQREPVTGMFLHVDFLEVSLTEKLHAKVQIELVGDAPAVKNYNGVMVPGLEEIEVEALPRDLPERITVDISVLAEIGEAIYVRDIVLSSAVEILDDPEEIIVVITAPAREEVEETVEGAAAEPEVIERGKKEEEF
jgi:large subunit ribosomal protein L25